MEFVTCTLCNGNVTIKYKNIHKHMRKKHDIILSNSEKKYYLQQQKEYEKKQKEDRRKKLIEHLVQKGYQLYVKLSDIIKANNQVEDKIKKGASEETIRYYTILLQYHIFTFIIFYCS